MILYVYRYIMMICKKNIVNGIFWKLQICNEPRPDHPTYPAGPAGVFRNQHRDQPIVAPSRDIRQVLQSLQLQHGITCCDML